MVVQVWQSGGGGTGVHSLPLPPTTLPLHHFTASHNTTTAPQTVMHHLPPHYKGVSSVVSTRVPSSNSKTASIESTFVPPHNDNKLMTTSRTQLTTTLSKHNDAWTPTPSLQHRMRRGLYDYPDNPWGRRVYGRPQNYGKRRWHRGRRPHRYPYARRRNAGSSRGAGQERDYDHTAGGSMGLTDLSPGDVVFTDHSPKTVSFAYAKASGVAKVSKVEG